MASLFDNIFLLSTLVLSYIAWLIAFIGACVFRTRVSGGAWWIVVYELLLIIGVTCILTTHTFIHYRMMILAFLGASISLLTFQLDSIVPISRLIGGGSSAYASGYVILIIIQFIWVMIFGSDSESFVGQYGPCHYSNNNAVGVHQPQYEMGREEKTTLSDPVIEQSPPPTTTTTAAAAAAAAAAQATAVPSPTTVEYRERVQALHAYQANPEDPNELSFSKGEILEIVDRNGNWWQARKSDGTEGIIPSNYFAPSS